MVFLVQSLGFWDTENWRPAVFFRQATIIRPRNRASLVKVGSQPSSSGPSVVAPLGRGCLDPPMPQLRALD